MMTYVLGATAGALIGSLVGGLKYLLLWKKIMKAPEGVKFGMSQIYGRLTAGYVINAAALIGVYLVRNILPFSFTACVVATAIGLSISGKFFPMETLISRADMKS